MLAAIRPDSWNFPLFLHVLGAIILAGAVASAALASGPAAVLRGLPFRILVLLALPSWLLMRLAGQWIDSKENIQGDPTWLGIGFTVGDIGLVVLLVATVAAWWARKRPELRWPRQAAGGLAIVYLIALAVAWWTMSTKPGA
jgi:hypothetical protein